MQAKRRSPTPSAASSGSRPPELSLFLDESLDSLSVVAALRDAGASVVRYTERFPQRGLADEVWLAECGKNDWIALTRDKRIRYRQTARLALREAKVRAFVFTGGNVTAADTGLILTKALERIRKICRANPGPFIYHIGVAGRPIKMD